LYISVKKNLISQCLGYTIGSAITALFGGIYEIFSHNVYSYFMIYAFALPLVFGALPTLIMALKSINPNKLGLRLYAYGITTLTVGSIIEGILKIYGTTNQLVLVYIIAGSALFFFGAAIIIGGLILREKNDA